MDSGAQPNMECVDPLGYVLTAPSFWLASASVPGRPDFPDAEALAQSFWTGLDFRYNPEGPSTQYLRTLVPKTTHGQEAFSYTARLPAQGPLIDGTREGVGVHLTIRMHS